MFWLCVIVAVVCLFVMLKIKFGGSDKIQSPALVQSPKPIIKMLNRDGDVHEDEWHTYIAGVNHHASKYDIGGFCGYVANDPTNAHDPDAMGVYNSFKMLGYISAKELKDYRRWCDAGAMPCVGFVFLEDGQMHGLIKVLKPCNNAFLETEFSRYLQWVKDNYGSEYLPKNLTMILEIEQ